ncbi:MAG: alpha/beta hydrolase [Candidatus Odinarchaeota archaeon]
MEADKQDASDEWSHYVFHPRPNFTDPSNTDSSFDLAFEVDKGVTVVNRLHIGGKDVPNILFFHGNGETVTDYDDIGAGMAYSKNGINLLVTDYRGYGNSNGKPSIRYMLKDAHTLFARFEAFLEEKGFTGPVFVMGRSLGSAPAIELAKSRSDHLKGLILESGFAHTFNLLRFLGVPANLLDPSIENKYSNQEMIKHVKIPLLVIHGENDFLIPVQDGHDLFKACGTEESRKRILVIKNAGHNDIWFTGGEQYMKAVTGFIDNFS